MTRKLQTNINTALLLIVLGYLLDERGDTIWAAIAFGAAFFMMFLDAVSTSLDLLKRYYQRRLDKK